MYTEIMVLYDSCRPKTGHVAIALFYAFPENDCIGDIFSYCIQNASDIGKIFNGTKILGNVEQYSIPESMYWHFVELASYTRAKLKGEFLKQKVPDSIYDGIKKIQKTIKAMTTPLKKKGKCFFMNSSIETWRYDHALHFYTNYDFEAITKYIEKSKNITFHNNCIYNVMYGNCAHFVQNVITAGGIICPDFAGNIKDFFTNIFRSNYTIAGPCTGHIDIKQNPVMPVTPDRFETKPVPMSKILKEGAKLWCPIL